MIIEGIERANRELAGLPERVLHRARPGPVESGRAPSEQRFVPPPPVLHDAEGDILNTGTAGGKPAKDLSLNFVPVPYPEYTPAVIADEAVRAATVAGSECFGHYLSGLASSLNGAAQPLGVVSLDGVPIDQTRNGRQSRHLGKSRVAAPSRPSGIYLEGAASGVKASSRDPEREHGPDGENDPTRPLATIVATPTRPSRQRGLRRRPSPYPPSRSEWLGDVKPVRTRKLYFSENHRTQYPKSPTVFITVDGQTRAPFDPSDRSQYHRAARRRGRLDHRESHPGSPCVSHPPDPFHPAGMEWRCRWMSRFCATP